MLTCRIGSSSAALGMKYQQFSHTSTVVTIYAQMPLLSAGCRLCIWYAGHQMPVQPPQLLPQPRIVWTAGLCKRSCGGVAARVCSLASVIVQGM